MEEDDDEDLDLMNAPDLDWDESEDCMQRRVCDECIEGTRIAMEQAETDVAIEAAVNAEREKYAALLAAVDAVLVSYHRGRLAEDQHELMYHLREERDKLKGE